MIWLYLQRTLAAASALCSFSLQHSGPRQDLHSFPTRRSSDLEQRPRRSRAHRPGGGEQRTRQECRRRAGRSEEHTSELQSLTKIVCRLLLEKKKRMGKLYRASRIDASGRGERGSERLHRRSSP